MRPFDDLTDGGRVRRYRALAIEALRAYPFDVERLVPVREGECMIFRAHSSDGARYVVRIHNPAYQTPESIRSERAWLAALRGADLLVPAPVPGASGEGVVTATAKGIDGDHPCDVLEWQDGRHRELLVTPPQARDVGRLLARMHAAPFAPPPWFTRQRWDGTALFGRPVDECARAVSPLLSPEDVAVVERVIDRDASARAALVDREMVMLHADLTQGNLIFHRGEVRAIDFGDCGWGHAIYDIAVALSPMFFTARYEPLRDALLAGYREIRPFPEEDERWLPAMIATRRFSLAAWLVIRWNSPKIDHYLTQLRSLDDAPSG